MQFNERTNTLLYKNISLSLYSPKCWSFWGVWEMGGETYTQRDDFLYLLPGARGCQRLHHLASSSETPLIVCVSLARLPKSDHVVLITWSPSGYTPVRPKWPDAPSSSCLLIKIWQLIKALGVTWNEQKIHIICYITIWMGYNQSILSHVGRTNYIFSVRIKCILLNVSSWRNNFSDGLRSQGIQVQTPFALLCSLRGQFLWESYKSFYPSS